jgi:hypothetical protein
MKRAIQAFTIFVCTSVFLSVAAESVRQITWDDLIPANLIAEDPVANLTEEQQDMVYWVINMLESLPERSQETEDFYKEIDEAMPTLKKYDIDIAAVMEKRKEIQTAVVAELNGKHVRIPGYLLPLEVSQEKVTEFLLVPYVGACIHVPPPPPNQIVNVKTAAKKGYAMKQLYDPVWVTGVISIQSMVKDLFLVDGSADIDIGYTMQAKHIEPYE